MAGRLRLVLLATVLVLTMLAVVLQGGGEPAAPIAETALDLHADVDADSAAVPPAATPFDATAAPLHRIAPSQSGSEVDGAIRFDAFGRLVVDIELRRLFDYHLAAIGELSLDEIGEALQALAHAEGGDRGAAQVLAAFARYLEYLDQVDRLTLPPQPDLLQRFEALHALRRQYLGDAVAAAFFAEEDAAALDLIARIEDAASGDALAQREPLDDSAWAIEQTRQFERDGTDPGTRFAERSTLFGAEAAARLAALDDERAHWRQRVEAFDAARRALLNDPDLDEPARQAALTALLEARFDEAERRRVLSLMDGG